MTARHFLVPALLVLCLVLGGASIPAEGGGFRGNLALQLLSIPLIGWAIIRDPGNQPIPARTLVLLATALVAVILLQVVPLPPSVWTALPGRERVADGFEMIGQDLPWLPVSLNPEASVASLLWLLPAFAALLGIVRLGAYRTNFLAWTLVGVTIASVMLSALQLTGGADSPFYFYDVTNPGMGVGFFANGNHQATLLLCALPFAAALYAGHRRSASVKRSSGLATMLGGAAIILAVGLVINGSLAGIGLGVAVVVAGGLMLRYHQRPVPAWGLPSAGLGLLFAAAGILTGPTTGGILSPETSTSVSTRQEMVGTTLTAAGDFFPVGSGVGTFAGVYRLYEDPADTTTQWINHAHSDFVEIALEAGILGVLLILILLWWWGRRAFMIWIKDEQPDHYARAATVASAAIIFHSLVDYPLRTAAISAVFAVCLALMAQPRPSARAAGRSQPDLPRHLTA